MKLTKSKLKQIIQEELQNILNEQYAAPGTVERGLNRGINLAKQVGSQLRKHSRGTQTRVKRGFDVAADVASEVLAPVAQQGHDIGVVSARNMECPGCSRKDQLALQRAMREWRNRHADWTDEVRGFALRELEARGIDVALNSPSFARTGGDENPGNFPGGLYAWIQTLGEVAKIVQLANAKRDDPRKTGFKLGGRGGPWYTQGTRE